METSSVLQSLQRQFRVSADVTSLKKLLVSRRVASDVICSVDVYVLSACSQTHTCILHSALTSGPAHGSTPSPAGLRFHPLSDSATQ